MKRGSRIKTSKGEKVVEDVNREINKLICNLKEVDDEEKFPIDYYEGYELRRKAKDQVVKKLIEIGRPAVPALVGVLQKHDTWSAILAAEILGKIGDERAIQPLLRCLEDKEDLDFLHEEAMFALVKIGRPAVPYLIKSVERNISDDLAIIYPIGALGRIRCKESFEFLIKLLNERPGVLDKPLNIEGLVCSLVDQGNRDAIPHLEKLDKRIKRVASVEEAIGDLATGNYPPDDELADFHGDRVKIEGENEEELLKKAKRKATIEMLKKVGMLNCKICGKLTRSHILEDGTVICHSCWEEMEQKPKELRL